MQFIKEIREPQIKQIYEFWLARHRAGRLPLKADIDPVLIERRLLPNLFMYRLEPCGRFRALLAGTEIDFLYRGDMTGKYLDEILPEQVRDDRIELFERAVRERLPVYYSGRTVLPTREQRDISALLLPVTCDGEAADHIFGILIFGPVVGVFAPDLPVSSRDAVTNFLVADPDEPGAWAVA